MLNDELEAFAVKLQARRPHAEPAERYLLDDAVKAIRTLLDLMNHDEAPACAILSPPRFYLICERRGDGGLRLTCPEVPGLALSHADPEAVMRDVMPAIDKITRHNSRPKSRGGYRHGTRDITADEDEREAALRDPSAPRNERQ